MVDFKVIIEDDEQIVVDQEAIWAFRFYERLSGLEPTLDKSREDLRLYNSQAIHLRDGEVMNPEADSPFHSSTLYHTPPVLGHEPKVQPPYYAQVWIEPALLDGKREIDDLLGCPARLEITEGSDADPRHVRGIILRALERSSPDGTENAIELQIYPWLWALSLSEKSRVWSNANSITVLDKLIEEYQPEFADSPGVSKLGLSSEPALRENIIQWQESDFELLSRLLERDGVYYFFKHDETTTTIILGDSKSPYAEGHLPNRSLTFHSTGGPGGELFDDHIDLITTQVQTVPRSYHVADYNPLLAGTKLDYVIPQDASDTALRIYDYPGDVAAVSAGPDAASRRYTAVTAREKIIFGASRSPFISAGHATTISGENTSDDKVLRVTQVVHELVRGVVRGEELLSYRNWFEGIEGTSYYAPTQRTPLPAINGTHNAIVVSSLDGETVDLDEDSRALVTFRWDQDEVPVRVRLGQPTAGNDYGTSVLPRAGQEVLISFIQGNTERPIILTSLNNSDNQKSFNPTQMATQGLDGESEENIPTRQNRYTTAVQNTTGNLIYFNDTQGDELFQLKAYKDFVLEIGHKEVTTSATTSAVSTSGNTTAGSYGDLSDVLDDESTGTFQNVKADRGTALIRSYGDLTLYVGKLGKVFDEVNPGDRTANTNILDVYDSESDDSVRLDDKNRGDFNTYVMGGTSTVALGSYAWVLSPKSDTLVGAEFTFQSDLGWHGKSTYTNGTSIDLSIAETISFGASVTSDFSIGFSTETKASASLSTSLSMAVASSLSLMNVEQDLEGIKVSTPWAACEAKTGVTFTNEGIDTKGSDATAVATTQVSLLTLASLNGAVNTIVAVWSLYLLETGLVKFSKRNTQTDARSDMQTWMTQEFAKQAEALAVLQGVQYAINLLYGVAVSYNIVQAAATAVALGQSPVDVTSPFGHIQQSFFRKMDSTAEACTTLVWAASYIASNIKASLRSLMP